MFAVVETCGKQYRVQPGGQITVDRLQAEAGATITLDRVLMVGGTELKVGAPLVPGAKVTAKVVAHELGEKLITFKYRPKERFRRRVGFRARLTTLEIVSIDA